MKARIKSTGEIVEVQNYDYGDNMYLEKIGEMSGRVFHISEIDFDNLDTPDYWERLKHQYAGMAMQGMLSCKDIIIEMGNLKDKSIEYGIALASNNFATALVERMKETNNQ